MSRNSNMSEWETDQDGLLKQSPDPKIWTEGKRLIIEWDNRKLPTSGCTKFVFFVSEVAGIAIAVTVIAAVVGNRISPGYLPIALMAVIASVAVAITWMIGRSPERVEICPEFYKHYFVNLKSLFSKSWDLGEINEVTINVDSDVDNVNLTVHGPSLDRLCFWGSEKMKQQIFLAIRNHLKTIGSKIPSYDHVPTERYQRSGDRS